MMEMKGGGESFLCKIPSCNFFRNQFFLGEGVVIVHPYSEAGGGIRVFGERREGGGKRLCK